MPQMSPLNWLFLFVYFIMMVMLIIMFIYSLYLLKFDLEVKPKTMNYMIWMW